MIKSSCSGGKIASSLLFFFLLLLAFTWVFPAQALGRGEREELTEAIAGFEALREDKGRGMQREPWEKLEKTFASIRGGKGIFAPEAHFYQARCREELADRSKRRADYQESLALYRSMVKAYPKHLLADNALYNQAMLLSGPMNDKSAALKVLDELILAYPDGDMQVDALRLRERLENSLGRGSAARSAPQAQPGQASAKTSSQSRQPAATARAEQPQPRAEQAPARAVSAPSTGTSGAASGIAYGGASQKDLESQRKLYNASADTWRKLVSGQDQRAKYRDSWMDVEEGFKKALAAAPAGPLADKSAYQMGRSREELAKRSSNRDDWREAARLYAKAAADYPESSLADDCLYYRALILADRLNELPAAAEQARDIMGRYPSGDMAGPSATLLKRVESGKSAAAQAETAKGTATTQPQTPSIAHSGVKPVAGPGSIAAQLGLDIKTVVVDAGHGGRDPGAIGNGIKESEYTMNLANMLGYRLKKRGFNVIYTRSSDKYVALRDRTSLSNAKKADIFISLHVNSSTNKSLHGFEIYYLDTARNDAAALVAARENAVDLNATSDLQFILSDLNMNSKRDESEDASGVILDYTLRQFKKHKFNIKSNGVKSAPFHVLLGARMPAILVEAGYLSNAEDIRYLKNKKYMEALADGITDGIVAYKTKITAMRP